MSGEEQIKKIMELDERQEVLRQSFCDLMDSMEGMNTLEAVLEQITKTVIETNQREKKEYQELIEEAYRRMETFQNEVMGKINNLEKDLSQMEEGLNSQVA